jgi:hypothetical protein
MACLLAAREESTGSHYVVTDIFDESAVYFDSRNPPPNSYGLPVQRSRPPNFTSMARPESEADPDAPRHPGVTFWDFVDSHNLDPNDPVIPAAHLQALADYRKQMAEYSAKKAAAKAAAIPLHGR